MAVETVAVGEIRVARATVPEASRHQHHPVLYAPGVNAVGGPDDRLLAEWTERLAQLCRLEVIGVNPPGIGGADGCFDTTTAIASLRALLADLGPTAPILVGFGLVGLLLLAVSDASVALATIDPLVNPFEADELRRLGVRVGDEGAQSLPAAIGSARPPASWLVINSADRERPDPVGLTDLLALNTPELHRLFATEHDLHADPRTWALILGWIERAPWQRPTAAPAPTESFRAPRDSAAAPENPGTPSSAIDND